MRRQLHKLYIVNTLIICLIGSLLIPVAMSASATSNKVLLCTSQGYQWVSIDKQGSPKEQVKHCAVCFLSDQSDDILFSYNSCLQSVYAEFRYIAPAPYRLTSQTLERSTHPRAPPASILSS